MKKRVKLFQPFEETELRIKVTVEVLADGATFDCFAVDARAAATELDAELERRAVTRARQLLAVAAHSLSSEGSGELSEGLSESGGARAGEEARGDASHAAPVSGVTPAA
jgi:hypothetical protein